jgi:ferredoxin
MGDAGHRQEKYSTAQGRIPAIAAAIRERKSSVPEGSDSRILRFGGLLTRTLMTSVYRTPRRLHATGKCNHCRTCERVCPARNITVDNGAVQFGNSCTQCYACIHWCPEEAIEIGGRTSGKPRYHHPDVSLKDMLDQRGG